MPCALVVPPQAFPVARSDGRVLEDVVMRADDDRRGILLDHLPPPPEGFSTNYPARVSAERAAPDLLCRLVDVAHHEEEEVADAERVMLPGAVDRKRSAARIDAREPGVLAGRIDPLAPPPGLRFVESTAVVVAGEVIDLLAAMPLERGELPHHFLSFR